MPGPSVSGNMRERIASRISPYPSPEIFYISFRLPLSGKINQFSMPELRMAVVSNNFLAFDPIISRSVVSSIPATTVSALPLRELIKFKISIKKIPICLKAFIRGKFYYLKSSEQKQLLLIEKHLGSEECIHGMPKNTCSICYHKKIASVKRDQNKMDIFDIILPVLQPPPENMKGLEVILPPGKEPYPFQSIGIKALVENNEFLLGDEMGLGKSIQAIVALKILFRRGEIIRCLIVCPRSVLTDWSEKFWDWAPELSIKPIDGSISKRKAIWESKFHVSIVTYGTLHRDSEFVQPQKFDIIILDEAQKIKNRGTKTSKSVKSLHAERRWVLTGTPLENKIEDLTSIFEFIKPGLMDPINPPSNYRTSSLMKPYFLRRKKMDVLDDLREKKLFERWVELTPEQHESYEKAEKEGVVYLKKLEEEVTVFHILQLIQVLKQICNFDPKTGKSSKADAIVQMLEGITDQGDKAIIFSQYANIALPKLKERLLKYNPLIYTGSLSSTQRDRIVKKFQNSTENKILLISRAGETGITLTAANYVFHFDMWWNPASGRQLEDRTHRIGQKKSVFVYRFFCKDTYEERIYNILREKQQLFDMVIDNLSDRKLDKMITTRELFDIFGLKQKKKDDFERERIRVVSGLPKDPREFEQVVAGLYKKMGYKVKLSSCSKDHGIDIHARQFLETGEQNIAIQCKHYPSGTVGVSHVRDLYGVLSSNVQLTYAHLVTSGNFSKEAQEFAQGKRISLINGSKLNGWMLKYGKKIRKTTP